MPRGATEDVLLEVTVYNEESDGGNGDREAGGL
jgi:hypothetical protein